MIWWFFNAVGGNWVFENGVDCFPRQRQIEAWSKSDFGPQHRFVMILISFHGIFDNCLCGNISDIWWSFMLIRCGVDGRTSVLAAPFVSISQWDRCHRQIILPEFSSHLYMLPFYSLWAFQFLWNFWRIVIPISSVFFLLWTS